MMQLAIELIKLLWNNKNSLNCDRGFGTSANTCGCHSCSVYPVRPAGQGATNIGCITLYVHVCHHSNPGTWSVILLLHNCVQSRIVMCVHNDIVCILVITLVV